MYLIHKSEHMCQWEGEESTVLSGVATMIGPSLSAIDAHVSPVSFFAVALAPRRTLLRTLLRTMKSSHQMVVKGL